jgi:hypothetical protein
MVAELVAQRAQKRSERGDFLAHCRSHPHADEHRVGRVVPEELSNPEGCDRRRISRPERGYLTAANCRAGASSYVSYQLLRNVLAAYALNLSFCVLVDARRPDLREHWYTAMRCVRPMDLKTRCKVLTLQEVAQVLPLRLRNFLDLKYGIVAAGVVSFRNQGDCVLSDNV